ncbi:rCG35352 [Rattus norvegicus]|uniref:RCG35352 n=1 Tax=Rattus norvegicus TaxID=10116 RepID=A6HE71_RAT|nr:rCG35352 [Rattus norvegicus]
MSSGAGVTGSSGLPNAGAGNQTQILCMRSRRCLIAERLSSPSSPHFNLTVSFFFGFFFSELGTEPRALRFLGKRSTTELNPQPPI